MPTRQKRSLPGGKCPPPPCGTWFARVACGPFASDGKFAYDRMMLPTTRIASARTPN